MRITRFLAVAAVILGASAVAAYVGYSYLFPSETVRYRLTLEVDVDGKAFAGSSVLQVTRQDTAIVKAFGGYGAMFKGEAVAVELGNRGILFALLQGKDIGISEDDSFPPNLIMSAFGRQGNKLPGDYLAYLRELNLRRPKADLPTRLLPMLVRFRHIHDRESVEQVDPENLAASFGPGVSLRRATIEITDAPVTEGIERRLPWFSVIARGGALGGLNPRASNELKSNIGALSFKRGFE